MLLDVISQIALSQSRHKSKRGDGQWLWQPWDRGAGTEPDRGCERSLAAAPVPGTGQGEKDKELHMEGH